MGPDPVSIALMISALIAASGFMGMYATNSPWRVTPIGKAMMLLAFSVGLMIVSGIFLQLLGPDYPFRSLFRNLTYIILNIALWWQLANLIRVINHPPKELPKSKPVVTKDEDNEFTP